MLSLVVRKSQVKLTMRYHHQLEQLKFKRLTTPNVDKNREELSVSTL